MVVSLNSRKDIGMQQVKTASGTIDIILMFPNQEFQISCCFGPMANLKREMAHWTFTERAMDGHLCGYTYNFGEYISDG